MPCRIVYALLYAVDTYLALGTSTVECLETYAMSDHAFRYLKSRIQLAGKKLRVCAKKNDWSFFNN